MKFSAQEEYGLRCLIQIAQRPEGEGLTIPEISRLEGLSETHVAKMMMILRKDGVITATRGQSGGYRLAKPANQTLLSDVIQSLGGRLYDDAFCSKHSGQLDVCTHLVDCGVRSLWAKIQTAVDEVLEGLTIADILSRKHEATNVQFMEWNKRSKVKS